MFDNNKNNIKAKLLSKSEVKDIESSDPVTNGNNNNSNSSNSKNNNKSNDQISLQKNKELTDEKPHSSLHSYCFQDFKMNGHFDYKFNSSNYQ